MRRLFRAGCGRFWRRENCSDAPALTCWIGGDCRGLDGERGRLKTLANATDRDEIVRRLRALGPSSQRRWGKMSVGEMVCHLNDALKIAMGERKAKSISNWFTRTVMKRAGLSVPMKWPHGVQTVPECEAGKGGTPPAELERDLNELHELLDRFARRPRQFELTEHSIFGVMSDEEWMRWGYLHMDHHLRQFGA
jgi:hypothetical protein